MGVIVIVGVKEFEDCFVINVVVVFQGKVVNLNIFNGDGGLGKKVLFNI